MCILVCRLHITIIDFFQQICQCLFVQSLASEFLLLMCTGSECFKYQNKSVKSEEEGKWLLDSLTKLEQKWLLRLCWFQCKWRPCEAVRTIAVYTHICLHTFALLWYHCRLCLSCRAPWVRCVFPRSKIISRHFTFPQLGNLAPCAKLKLKFCPRRWRGCFIHCFACGGLCLCVTEDALVSSQGQGWATTSRLSVRPSSFAPTTARPPFEGGRPYNEIWS